MPALKGNPTTGDIIAAGGPRAVAHLPRQAVNYVAWLEAQQPDNPNHEAFLRMLLSLIAEYQLALARHSVGVTPP